jgi:hypothetical protein
MSRHYAHNVRQSSTIHERLTSLTGGGTSLLMMELIRLAALGKMDALDWKIVDAVMFSDCATAYSIAKKLKRQRSLIWRRMQRLAKAVRHAAKTLHSSCIAE